MERVTIQRIEADRTGGGALRRALTEPLQVDGIAFNHYDLPPGERLAGLHAHEDQEEIFTVLDGQITFETLDGEHTVEDGEVVRFAPGEFQSGKNDGDTEATVFAVGAPRESEQLRVPVQCPSCESTATEPTVRDGDPILVCPSCGHESAVECPECASKEVRAELGPDGERPVSACQKCGATWAVR